MFLYGLGGDEYLLLLCKTYSGKLEGVPLKDKSFKSVFLALQNYKSIVKTKYRLYIVIQQHDNKRAVITINEHSETEYQIQAREKGQTIKLPLPYTYRPTSKIERARREIIEKLITIVDSTNLLLFLQNESTIVAIYLYSMLL